MHGGQGVSVTLTTVSNSIFNDAHLKNCINLFLNESITLMATEKKRKKIIKNENFPRKYKQLPSRKLKILCVAKVDFGFDGTGNKIKLNLTV